LRVQQSSAQDWSESDDMRELRRRDLDATGKILCEVSPQMMRTLDPDEHGDVHMYECKYWTPEDLLTGEEIVHSHCVYCHACLCSFKFTATRCEATGHYMLCPDCMAALRDERGHQFKNAGYIRKNKLERIQ
jgi:hypothetical protein